MAENKILKKPDKIVLSNPVSQIKLPDQEKYHEILEDMVLAFYKQRKGCETQQSTEKYCRGVLDTCITGFHRDGRLWKHAPGKDAKDWFEGLQKRLNVFKYDLVTKQMIPSGRGKTSEKIKESAKNLSPDSDIPPAVGMADRSLSPAEMDEFKRFQREFTEAFPESVTAVDEMLIKRLAFFMVLNNRDITFVDVSKDLTKEIQMLVETLGVSGKQRNAAMNVDRSGTLELLTTKYKRTRDEHLEIEKNYMLEELKLISNQVKMDTVPEFLAMYWIKTLYGDQIEGEELSIAGVDRFLRKQGIDV
jgi:hypothetical protein